MSNFADRFVVLLDASVLCPLRKRDVLLRFYDAGLFRARWTSEVLKEWSSKLEKIDPTLKHNVQAQRQTLENIFPDALVTRYQPLEAGLELPDRNDHHVLAAAIQCGAQHIITDRVGDFPQLALDQFEIEAIEADEFLARTFELYTVEAMNVLRQLRSRYQEPQMTPSEFVLDLTAHGMPKLAAQLRIRRQFL